MVGPKHTSALAARPQGPLASENPKFDFLSAHSLLSPITLRLPGTAEQAYQPRPSDAFALASSLSLYYSPAVDVSAS